MLIKDKLIKDQWVGILILCPSEIQNQRQSSFYDQWGGIPMLYSSKIQDQKQSSLKEQDI